MKIYVVTSGCYSDYNVDAVFTDEAKAKEYSEWLPESQVEVYDTEDDKVINKYYKIYVEYTMYFDDPNKIPNELNITIKKTQNDWCCPPYVYIHDQDAYLHKSIRIIKHHIVKNENWDEEFYRKKFTQGMYDTAAQVTAMYLDGYTAKEIKEVLAG